MVAPSEYHKILNTISQWSAKDREQLISQIKAGLQGRPKSNHGLTMNDFVGVARGDGPPPNDEEVRKIVEAALLEKYGK